MHIYAYVIYCLEAWPHVSKAMFCFINICTYMHMWCIVWRHGPMYLSQCFVLSMYAHICICDVLLGDMTPCIWASVLFYQCMHIYAYVIYCLETWPHVSEPVFCFINACTYMHMWYIAWRHDSMYPRQCFVLLMLGDMTPCIWVNVLFNQCMHMYAYAMNCLETLCIILPGDMTHMYLGFWWW